MHFLVRMLDALGTSWRPPEGDAIRSKLMTLKRQDTFKMVANKYSKDSTGCQENQFINYLESLKKKMADSFIFFFMF